MGSQRPPTHIRFADERALTGLTPSLKLIQQRVSDQHTGRVTFAILVAALSSAMARADAPGPVDIGDRILAEVATMRSLIAEVEV